MRRIAAGLALLAVPALLAVLFFRAQDVHPPEEHMDLMRGDLRNLMVRQEIFFQEHGRYADTMLVTPLEDRTVLTIIEADANGWSAIATRPGQDWRCGVFVGGARPVVRGDTVAGEPTCGPAPATF